mmetsp:Transcript_71658/g.133977  ORF Transcript_71658/g.133977 Transcript_71658/m.133977 type:complete len:247 (+) Transcript_71658:67-807(+)
MGEEEEKRVVLNRASVEDEFLRHPHSGAFIRNPLMDKTRTAPILFQMAEFQHNCLEDAMADWHCISMSESSFRALTAPASTALQTSDAGISQALDVTVQPPPPMTPATLKSTLQRAALNRLRTMPSSYEFLVSLRKSNYVPPPYRRRRAEAKVVGTLLDKLAIDVSEVGGRYLCVESVKEGLVGTWNHSHAAFAVKPGDLILKVNDKVQDSSAMLEELLHGPDYLRITVRRSPPRGQELTLRPRPE